MLSLDFLRSEGVEESLIKDLEAYRGKFPVTEADKDRVPIVPFHFLARKSGKTPFLPSYVGRICSL